MAKADIRAAGAVIWRIKDRKTQVLIVHRPRWNDWSFPKGKLKEGEGLRQCCIREMKEETGLDIVLGVPLGWQRYVVGRNKKKEVRYWLAQEVPADHPAVTIRPRFGSASKKEVDKVRWVTITQAKRLLTRRGDREILGRMADLWADDKHKTIPLLITRHTRAMKRSAWQDGTGPEETRPLTDGGAARAQKLVAVFSVYGVERIVSSPWKRCVDTVGPYAQETGLPIETDDVMTEAAHEQNPKKIASLLRKNLRKEMSPLVLSVHRPTLPTLMGTLEEFTPQTIMRQVPEKDPWLRTGEVMVAHVANRHGKAPLIVAYEKIRPAAG